MESVLKTPEKKKKKRKAVGEKNSKGIVIGEQAGEGRLVREDIFAREIVQNNKNQSDAYRIIFPNCLKWKKKASVHNRACAFAKNPRVKARIAFYRTRIVDKFDFEIDQIVKGLHNIAFNDPAEMYDEKGNIKKIHDMPLDSRRTLASVKHGVQMRTVAIKDGVEVCEPETFIKEYTQESRRRALEQLLQYKLDTMRDPLPIPVVHEEEEVNKVQLARELLLLVYEVNREG